MSGYFHQNKIPTKYSTFHYCVGEKIDCVEVYKLRLSGMYTIMEYLFRKVFSFNLLKFENREFWGEWRYHFSIFYFHQHLQRPGIVSLGECESCKIMATQIIKWKWVYVRQIDWCQWENMSRLKNRISNASIYIIHQSPGCEGMAWAMLNANHLFAIEGSHMKTSKNNHIMSLI